MTTETRNNKRAAKLFGRCAECRIPMIPGVNKNGTHYSSDGCDRLICTWCYYHNINSDLYLKSPYCR